MEIFEKPNAHYTVDDHLAYHQESLIVCKKHEVLIDDHHILLVYEEKVEQEKYIYKWNRKSEFTPKKSETDKQRDNDYYGLLAVLRASLKVSDPLVQDAALHVQNFLSAYGDVPNMAYDAETVAIDSVVRNLQGPLYVQAVARLGLAPWVSRLENSNERFKTYVADVTAENLSKPEITALASRKESDVALRNIMMRINALAEINGKDAYLLFAKELNEITNHYNVIFNEHYGRLHAQIDISDAIVDKIPDYTYTGKHITVIPVVKRREILNDVEDYIELVFPDDFFVDFKNNVEPGTATIIITGTGKYKGEIVTTFNINKQ